MYVKSFKNYFYPYFLLTSFVSASIVVIGFSYHYNKVEDKVIAEKLKLYKSLIENSLSINEPISRPISGITGEVKWLVSSKETSYTATNNSIVKNGKFIVQSFPYKDSQGLILTLSANSHRLLPESELFSIRLLVTLTILIILTILLSWRMGKRIGQPILQLNKMALQMVDGQFQNKIPVSLKEVKEIKELSQSMNLLNQKLGQKINEMIVKTSEQEALFLSMSEGVIAVDKKKKITNCNTAAMTLLSLTGFKSGISLYEFIRNPDLIEIVEKFLKSPRFNQSEICIQNEKNIKVTANPLFSVKGKVLGGVFVFSDQTQAKNLEKQRKEFVSNVSHELRTPLTIIQGFVETLMSPEFNDLKVVKKHLKTILLHSSRLNKIIEDLLILSKLESKSFTEELKKETVNVNDFLRGVFEVIDPKWKELPYTLDYESQVDEDICIHPDLLQQALLNLIHNAFRYIEGSNKTVLVRSYLSKNEVVVSVKDFGKGIDKYHLPRLFERFYRVDKGRSQNDGGTGIGLSLVKHIVLLHNGRVMVESELGKGSEFFIFLPRIV